MGLGLAAAAGAGVLSLAGSTAFEPYIGSAPPVVVVVVLVLLGYPLLRLLEREQWVPRPTTLPLVPGRLVAVALALSIPVAVVDVLGGFPEGINVSRPAAFLFYPTVAFVAETVFHVIPLGAVAAIRSGRGAPPKGLVVVSMVGSAVIEPVLQMMWGAGGSPIWANTYVGFHVFVFNLAGLWWFRRRGFVGMYAFRLSYYLGWHILWGALRLRLLF